MKVHLLSGKIIKIFLFSLLCFSTQNIFAQEENVDAASDTIPEAEIDLSNAKTISIQAKDRSYFASIPKDAIADLEKGSPSSIRNAVLKVRKSSHNYTNAEKTFLKTCTEIMNLAWPSVQHNFESIDFSENNPYLGAITSSRQGVYDSSTGNSDFLTLTLPSLVLLTSSSRNDYYALSEESLKKALELNPASIIANYLLATLYVRLEKYTEAIRHYKICYDDSNETEEIVYNYALTLKKNGNLKECFSVSSKFLLHSPLNRLFLKLSAETSFELKDYVNAEQFVARVLQQESDNTTYILLRAQILVEKGEFIKASSLLDVYARTDTTNLTYLILRSRIQKEWNRNITAATQTLEVALSLYPENEELLMLSSSVLSGTSNKILGMDSQQIAAKLLEKNPDNTTAQEIQIKELVRQKKWSEAYKLSSSLLKKTGTTTPSENLFTHIDICLAYGKNDEAFKIASSLYSQDSKNETIVQEYVKVLVATGKNAEANRIINSLLPTAQSKMKSFLFYQRSLLVTTEDQILSELRSSLTANPRNQDSLYKLYTIYFDKKEYRKAQYYLRQVVAINPTDEDLLKKSQALENLVK